MLLYCTVAVLLYSRLASFLFSQPRLFIWLFVVKSFVLLGARWLHYKKLNWHYYLLEVRSFGQASPWAPFRGCISFTNPGLSVFLLNAKFPTHVTGKCGDVTLRLSLPPPTR